MICNHSSLSYLFLGGDGDKLDEEVHIVAAVEAMPNRQKDQSDNLWDKLISEEFETFVHVPKRINRVRV